MLGFLYIAFMVISLIACPILFLVFSGMCAKRARAIREAGLRRRDFWNDTYAMLTLFIALDALAMVFITMIRTWDTMYVHQDYPTELSLASIMLVAGRGLLAIADIILFRIVMVANRHKTLPIIDKKPLVDLDQKEEA